MKCDSEAENEKKTKNTGYCLPVIKTPERINLSDKLHTLRKFRQKTLIILGL